MSTAGSRGRSAANIRSPARGPIPGNDAAGPWMPGDVEIRSGDLAGVLVLFVFVFIVFFVVFLIFLFVIRRIVLGEFKDG